MPQSGSAPVFGAASAVLSKMTADPVNGTTTFANGILIDDPQILDINPEILSIILRGGNAKVDIYSKVESIKGKFASAKFSLVSLQMLMGGTITDTGEGTGSQRRSWKLKKTSIPGSFKLELVCDYTGSENAGEGWHVILFKCKITNFQASFGGEKHASVTFDFEAIPMNGTGGGGEPGDLMEQFHEKTLTAASVTADSTPPTVAATTPADNATAIALNAPVLIDFSEDMRLDTINADHILVVKSTDGQPHPGTVVWTGGAEHRATFTPTGNYSASTKYLIQVIAPRDLAGNKMAAVYGSDFTTGT